MTRRMPDDGLRLRIAAGEIVVASGVWLVGAQWLGPAFGMSMRFVLLIDSATLTAFVWAMVVVFGIWRRRQHDEER